MSDPIRITTQTSWFSRLRSAFTGMITGVIFVLIAIGLLFWNEGRAVRAIDLNKEGVANVIAVPADRVNPANTGRLVHIAAPGMAAQDRQDRLTGVTSAGLLLSRKVEYFQWKESAKSETRTKLGGGQETVTTYSYAQEWMDMPLDSSRFQQADAHRNPAPALKNADDRADTAKIGAFSVDRAVLDNLTAENDLPLTPAQAEAAAKAMAQPVKLVESALYIGADPAKPVVGDMRVSYRVVPQGAPISIIGAQNGGSIQPYISTSGSPILMVRTGIISADQMFAQEKSANATMTWVLRGVGYLGIFIGFGMVLAPLGVIGDVVPFIGSILRFGTSLISGAAALTIGTGVIAIAWLFYRPILSLVLIALVAGVVYGLIQWKRRRLAAVAAPTAAAVATGPKATGPDATADAA